MSSDTRLWSGPRFAARWRELNQTIPIGTRQEAKACTKDYLLMGWAGSVAGSCQHFGLTIPQNLAWLFWGWPRKTVHRFEDEGLSVFLIGALDGPYQNIDTINQAESIPDDYRGWVITDRIEVVGPSLKGKN